MRWFTFGLLLYVAAAMQQTNLLGVPTLTGRPWPLLEHLALLAVFYALFASETSAPVAGFLCGLAADIVGPNTVGTCAVPLGLVAFSIVKVRQSIFREHAVSQVVLSFFAIGLYGVLSMGARIGLGAPIVGNSVAAHLGTVLGNAVYSALLAPVCFWLLLKLKPILGFQVHGLRSRSHG